MMSRIILAGLIALASQSAGAATIVNGSFELGNFTGAPADELNAPNDAITGWDVGPLGVDWVGSLWTASDGNRSVELASTDRGQLIQRLTGLTIGQSYRVGFDLAGNPLNGPATYQMNTTTSGAQVAAFSVDVTGANSVTNMGWTRRFFTFRAVSTAQDLQFLGQSDGPFGAVIDNVSLSAVPEPAAWMMMIGGFGLVGLMARRRQPVVAA